MRKKGTVRKGIKTKSKERGVCQTGISHEKSVRLTEYKLNGRAANERATGRFHFQIDDLNGKNQCMITFHNKKRSKTLNLEGGRGRCGTQHQTIKRKKKNKKRFSKQRPKE